MGKRIRVTVGDIVAEGQLLEERAPKTVLALWQRLPIRDRTIQARWSGDAWRTEGNYELLSKEAQRRKMSWDAAIWQIVQFLMTSSWELRAANHTTSKKLTTLKSDRNSPGISVPPRDVHMAISGSAQ